MIHVCYKEEGAMIDGMYQKWIMKFWAGDFSMDNFLWLNRLRFITNKALLENTINIIQNSKDSQNIQIK